MSSHSGGRKMSKQRRKHPEIVSRQKHFRGVKKGLSVLHNFQQYIYLSRVWQDLPKYHGTKFRGMKRWK